MNRADRELHAFLAACGLRFEGVHNVFAQSPRPAVRPLADSERAQIAEMERQLWARPVPVVLKPEPDPDSDWQEQARIRARAGREMLARLRQSIAPTAAEQMELTL